MREVGVKLVALTCDSSTVYCALVCVCVYSVCACGVCVCGVCVCGVCVCVCVGCVCVLCVCVWFVCCAMCVCGACVCVCCVCVWTFATSTTPTPVSVRGTTSLPTSANPAVLAVWRQFPSTLCGRPAHCQLQAAQRLSTLYCTDIYTACHTDCTDVSDQQDATDSVY